MKKARFVRSESVKVCIGQAFAPFLHRETVRVDSHAPIPAYCVIDSLLSFRDGQKTEKSSLRTKTEICSGIVGCRLPIDTLRT